jgi:hypothetical protein
MKWIPTPDSSAIDGFGYDPVKSHLHIKFRDGAAYIYLRVPKRIADEMCAASSKGRFVTARIKGRYNFKEK